MTNEEQLKKSCEILYRKLVKDIHTSRQNPIKDFNNYKVSKAGLLWNLTHGDYKYSARQFDYIVDNNFPELTLEEILQ